MVAGAGWALVNALSSSPKAVLLGASGLAALFACARYQAKRGDARLHALAHARSGQSICEFTRDFDYRLVDTWIIRAVYEQLQRQLVHIHPAFPIRADDRLKEDLLLDDDDLDLDVAQEVEARTRRTLDDAKNNPYFGKVHTVRDLVIFFQNQPGQAGAT
jgi:hypothetical protein